MAARKKQRKSIFPKLLLGIFVIYAAVTIVMNEMKAKQFNEDSAKVDEEIVVESIKKAKLEQELASEVDDEYVRREAQKQGFAQSNERVFYGVPEK